MNTQTIICPRCGKSTNVNVISGKLTTTPCQNTSCHTTIKVRADKHGRITDIDTGCFIATACIEATVDQDTAEEQLAVLRTFRDQVFRRIEGGEDLLSEYQRLAPVAVTFIAQRADAAQVFRHLYASYIHPAVRSIETGDTQQALSIYFQLMDLVKSKYLNISQPSR